MNKDLFFYIILGCTQSISGLLNDLPKSFIQIIPGTYESEKPNNITGFDNIASKSDCINGSSVERVRETILYSFAFDKTPRHIINKKLRIKIFE